MRRLAGVVLADERVHTRLIDTGPQRRFLIGFLGAIILMGAVPLSLIAGRFAALGEYELFDTDADLATQRIHGPLDLAELSYKARMAKHWKPRVLMLGSSQALQFRGSEFDKCGSPSCFYNAGAGMPTIRAGLEFYRELAAIRPPEVLLLAIDVWHVNPNYEENDHEPAKLSRSLADQLRLGLGITRKFAPQVVTDPELRDLFLGRTAAPANLRGARAVLRSEGFRQDGSYSYGTVNVARVLAQAPGERSADAVGRVARGCCRFQPFVRVDDRSLRELDELVDVATRAGTRVIALSVPLSDDVIDAVERDERQRSSFAEARRAVTEVLARHGLTFHAWTRASEMGCARSEMIDGFHPGEVCAARILRRLATSEPALRAFIDVAALSRRLERPASDLFMERP